MLVRELSGMWPDVFADGKFVASESVCADVEEAARLQESVRETVVLVFRVFLICFCAVSGRANRNVKAIKGVTSVIFILDCGLLGLTSVANIDFRMIILLPETLN